MKNTFAKLRTSGASMKASFAAFAVAASAGASAQLPDWASDIGTQAMGAVTEAGTVVGPVILASIVAVVGIKIIKRFSNKI